MKYKQQQVKLNIFQRNTHKTEEGGQEKGGSSFGKQYLVFCKAKNRDTSTYILASRQY